ncbi:S8 family serine peptidase [Deinococcus sp.]|uniref:S8 family peptidase n=1 Tax=Deinococcus sp. TaxID=47478 RepID=UPI003CC580B1
MKKIHLLFLPLSVLLLNACSSTPSDLGAFSGNQPGQVAPRYDYLATFTVQAGDTPASLQAASGGKLVGWNGADCAATSSCQAVIGLNRGLTTLSVSTLETQLRRSVTLEANRDQFSAGGAVTATIGGTRATWADGSLLAWTGGTRATWADGQYKPIPQNSQTWNTIRLQQAQSLAPNLGAGVTVAVIDTGLDLTHPAFQGSLSDPSTWQDYYAGDAVPQDEGVLGTGGYGHGSNVAGIILQIAPRAKIMPIRILGPDGSGDVLNVAKAISWATAKGATIINLSLGSSSSSSVVQDAIKAATAKNVVVVTSAGNGNLDKLTFPASLSSSFSNLLSVGSVDANDVKSSFSNYSKDLEVMAPGENVYAPAPGNLMAAWSGTSMSAPMVSGGLALALGQPLKVSVSGLLQIGARSSYNIYGVPLNAPYMGKLGFGRLDLAAFLTQAQSVEP